LNCRTGVGDALFEVVHRFLGCILVVASNGTCHRVDDDKSDRLPAGVFEVLGSFE